VSDDQKHVEELMDRATEAAREWARLDQEATDRIVTAIFRAAFARRVDLARRASDESGIGVFEHKVLKNAWASLLVYEDIIGQRTVGVLREDDVTGVTEVARPRGPILALTPLTNPTSTVIFKCLIAAKTRNPLIFSPHRAVRKSSREAMKVCDDAAREAGAPDHCFQRVSRPQREVLEAIMSHPKLALILATGPRDMVRWAQRSGNPVIGIGPGNVPVYVHEDADMELAARSILHSKTFDNGTVCASEQTLVVTRGVDARIRPHVESGGAYFCRPEEVERLGEIAFDATSRTMSPAVVGRSAAAVAELAGFTVPDGTRLLVAELDAVGKEYPLAHEILAPILAYHVAEDLDAAVAAARSVSRLGGVGHTVGVWTDDADVVQRFVDEVPAGRVVLNQPATQGAIGGIYNRLSASLTLGTGSGGGNLTMDNVSVRHLLNRQRVLRRRENARWMSIDRATWLDESATPEEVHARYNRMW
jgi:acetaldehyde dehydrogenase/alcohol dehydrogenase